MTTTKLATIGRYATPEEAEIVRLTLDAANIPCALGTETTAGWFWYWGPAIAGVKIQVAEADVERAREVLGGVAEDSPQIAGVCPACQAAVEPGFTACWSCGASLTSESATTEPSIAPEPPVKRQPPTAAEGYEEPTWEAQYPGDAVATRAWRAAIIGLVFCPGILHLYSGVVLLHLAVRDVRLSLWGRWKVVLAFVIDLAVAGLVGLALSRM